MDFAVVKNSSDMLSMSSSFNSLSAINNRYGPCIIITYLSSSYYFGT